MEEHTLGNNIMKFRGYLGLSQFQLGKLVDVSDKAVSKWENGTSMPKISVCRKLTDIFDVSLDMLLNGNLSFKTRDYIPLSEKKNWESKFNRERDTNAQWIARVCKDLGMDATVDVICQRKYLYYLEDGCFGCKFDSYNGVAWISWNDMQAELPIERMSKNEIRYSLELLLEGNSNAKYYLKKGLSSFDEIEKFDFVATDRVMLNYLRSQPKNVSLESPIREITRITSDGQVLHIFGRCFKRKEVNEEYLEEEKVLKQTITWKIMTQSDFDTLASRNAKI